MASKKNSARKKNDRKQQKKGSNKKILLAIIIIVVIILVTLLTKAGLTAQNISTKGGGFFRNLSQILPGGERTLRTDSDGRINIALIGIRGENVPGGGLLADTIMVASINSRAPSNTKNDGNSEKAVASLVSIPRDLYVDIGEDLGGKGKINAVHFYGEEKGVGQGLEAMKEVLGTITGQEVHYAVSINFEGFEEAIDDVDGITLTLEESFSEPLQFHQAHVCDEETFTVRAGQTEDKIDDRGKIVAQYPLCYNQDEECGGEFTLPAGAQRLNGENALCYARARMTSSDFERARRQQEVLGALEQKILSTGTLLNISRLTKLLDTLENNVRTDMELWEMEKFLDLYRSLGVIDMRQRVLDTTQEGLLYEPEETNGAGYILLPAGDTYEHIHTLFAEII